MKLPAVTLLVVLIFTSTVANSEELITLQTRPGVEQKLILIKPDKPVASVVLLEGGKGQLDLSSFFGIPTINKGENGFLARSRDTFANHDFLVALVDAPSDKKSKSGMLGSFRYSMEHVKDIDHVISYLRKQADVPVWLIGMSRGTESAANLAINSKQHPDGLVLTSSMGVPNAKGTALTEMPLDRITVPTLVVANSDDACPKTPPGKADEIGRMLASSKNVEVEMFSGGDKPISKPCWAMSYHGYLGIEDKVIDAIAHFIKTN